MSRRLEELNDEVTTALGDLDEQAERETRLRSIHEREVALLEAKSEIEKEERDKINEKWEAMCVSTQQIKNLPRISTLRWRTATEGMGLTTSSSSRQPASSGQPTRRPPQPTESNRSNVDPALDYQPWPDADKSYLLGELRRTDRRLRRGDLETLAEILQHPVEEVIREMELLKRAARSVARERGLEHPEPWSVS
jgi:hypothetical protein